MRETQEYPGSEEEAGLDPEINDEVLYRVESEINGMKSSMDPMLRETTESILTNAKNYFDQNPNAWNKILSSLSEIINQYQDGDQDAAEIDMEELNLQAEELKRRMIN